MPPAVVPAVHVPRCWDCRLYSAPGRDRSTCKRRGIKVEGVTANQPCFVVRLKRGV